MQCGDILPTHNKDGEDKIQFPDDTNSPLFTDRKPPQWAPTMATVYTLKQYIHHVQRWESTTSIQQGLRAQLLLDQLGGTAHVHAHTWLDADDKFEKTFRNKCHIKD